MTIALSNNDKGSLILICTFETTARQAGGGGGGGTNHRLRKRGQSKELVTHLYSVGLTGSSTQHDNGRRGIKVSRGSRGSGGVWGSRGSGGVWGSRGSGGVWGSRGTYLIFFVPIGT